MKILIKKLLVTTFTLSLLLVSNVSMSKGMSIDEPYVREVPPGQQISASFMTLKNDTDAEIALIKASSDVAKTVELHEHVHEGGMMKMRQVPKITVPAKGSTVLKPGGYHIMLIGLQRKIKAGDKIELALEFDNGTKETVTATVKKIMMGMMKGKMKGGMGGMHMKGIQKMKMKKHTNPMPNFMRVFMKMSDKLNLSAEQVTKLKAGMKERGPAIKELTASVVKLEADIYSAAINGEPLNKIDQLANSLMHERLNIIKGKTACRESFKEILDEKQFQKVVELYKENFMPKAEKMGKMEMIKHTNPAPNLMQVIKKMGDKLNLTKKQVTDLKKWGSERGPIMKKQYQAVMQLEADIFQAGLNNESVDKISQLGDAITQERIKIIRGKMFCRDNMKRILDDKQYNKVIELYKANN